MTRRLSIAIIAAAVLTLAAAEGSAEESEASGFSWFSIAPEVGYQYFFETEIDEDYDAVIGGRHGLVLKGHLDFGGDGVALEVAPIFAFESGSGLWGDFAVLGGELTLAFRGSWGSFYPGFGIGFRGAGIFENDRIHSGAELYARIPVGFTWYFWSHLGLVFEVGVMYGGTGIRPKDVEDPDPTDEDDTIRNNLAETDEMYWGAGFGLDILLGLRFP
jgi:hypothetical protein